MFQSLKLAYKKIDKKRVFDILFAVLILVITSPLIIFAMIGIKINSPGSVFFRGNRAGFKNIPFRMHKLRTMHVHDNTNSPIITGKDDPRIFKFGNFLRKTKIDELPQFIDVLRGKMSIVGPRPEDPEIVADHYTKEQKKLLLVKPGITSPAAIYYSETSDDKLDGDDIVKSYVNNVLSEKLKIELEYIENANLRHDLKIIFDTFLYILKVIASYLQTYFDKNNTRPDLK